jgi:ABC-type sugar transport system ATPase subunit
MARTTVNPQAGGLAPPRLRAAGLSKTFGAAQVLRDASVQIAAGEVHGLIGANGSGKSTLVKCLTGVHQADPGGTLEIDGQTVAGPLTPKAAARLGVRVVHQEAPLIDVLPLMDFVALHRGFPTRGRLIRGRSLVGQTRAILERLEIDVDPRALGGSLSAAERAMVMLALAVADAGNGAGLVVLDEPTASIPAHDADRFLEAVRRAAGQGVGVLLVTHRLAEVLDLCGRVTALRGGQVVLQTDIAGCTHDTLIDAIVGPTEEAVRDDARVRECKRFAPLAASDDASGGAALEVRGLCGDVLQDVSLSVARGEILGVSGIVGSGAAEIGHLLSGSRAAAAGQVVVGSRTLSGQFGPRESQAAGIAYVPGDRLHEGGIGPLTVRQNVTLPDLRRYWRDRKAESADLREVIETLDVRPPEPDREFATLSGGNQQKVIIGKWALRRPRVFVLDDPTAGVDPGAREEIYAVLRGLRAAGTAILLISSEPEQLERLADRVVVIKGGRVVEELAGPAATERAISAASL